MHAEAHGSERTAARAQDPGVDKRTALSAYYERVNAVYKKHNTHPFTALVPMLVQMPVFLGAFSALRAFALFKVRCRRRASGPHARGACG